MIITCEECERSFDISSVLIKETGSKVRCSKCGDTWTAYPDGEEEPAYEIVELSESEPDLNFKNDEEGLPSLEGLFEFDEEPQDDSAVLEDEGLAYAMPEDTDEGDCINLSDLEELLASDTPPHTADSDGDNPPQVDADLTQLPYVEKETETIEFKAVPDSPTDWFDTEDFPAPDKLPEETLVIEPDYPTPATGKACKRQPNLNPKFAQAD